MLQRADALIRKDQHFTTWKLTFLLSISKGSIKAIICELKYSKVCTKWVPRRSQTSAQNWENNHFFQVVRVLWLLRDETSYDRLLQKMKRRFIIILNPRWKDSPWNCTMLTLCKRKNSYFFQLPESWWSWCSGTVKEWFYLMWWGEQQLTKMRMSAHWEKWGSVCIAFGLTRTWVKCCFSTATQSLTPPRLGSNYTIRTDFVTASTL